MTRVKICGLTREEDVEFAIEGGADAVGFISGFPDSPRNIPLARVAKLIGKVPPFVDSVLVTKSEVVQANPIQIIRMAPSALQLYGGLADPVALKKKLRTKLILPHSMKPNGDGIRKTRGYDAVLSDTYRKGSFGGTGTTSDWDDCRGLREEISPIPFILSGGLNPKNVVRAITKVQPFAVDASSGVEASPGIKDRSKVKAFIDNARSL